eukprot:50521-Pelagomonas_calceolata.AAC.1
MAVELLASGPPNVRATGTGGRSTVAVAVALLKEPLLQKPLLDGYADDMLNMNPVSRPSPRKKCLPKDCTDESHHLKLWVPECRAVEHLLLKSMKGALTVPDRHRQPISISACVHTACSTQSSNMQELRNASTDTPGVLTDIDSQSAFQPACTLPARPKAATCRS